MPARRRKQQQIDDATEQLLMRWTMQAAGPAGPVVTTAERECAGHVRASVAMAGMPSHEFGPLQVLQYVRAADDQLERIGRLESLRCWFGWLVERGVCETDPTAGLRP